MSDIAGRIASLPPEKRALLAARLARTERSPQNPRQQLSASEQGISAPLSYTQQGVWFLNQLYPGNVAYNSPIAVRFTGRLDLSALEWSLNQVVRRHDLLRTVFELRDGDPEQRAYPFRPTKLRKMDFAHLPESERMEAAREEAVRLAQEPFDLVSGPLWRAKLLCCSEREHILVLILHHIVCDGWSIGVLMRELVAGYEAFLRGETSPLPELPMQYADYAVWQGEQVTGPAFQRHVENWRKHLEGVTGAIQIPLDKPRPAEPTFRGARVSAQVSAQLAESLRRIAYSEGATLFMVLLGAFKVLLSRYGGQDDIIVGSPFANRERRAFEGLIGFFANTLALRTDLSGDPTFVDLLARVRETTMRAYDCQEVPFEKLVEELRPERQLNRNPFFDISFSFQNFPMPAINVPDLNVDLLRVDNATSKFDLSVVIVETPRGLTTTVEYSSDLFDPATATRLLGNYRTLLEGIAQDPRRKISRFGLLTDTERERILLEWNQTAIDYPRDRCIHELFQEHARSRPEAVAVIFGGEKLTYGELDLRSSRLAGYLKMAGVGRGARVAISMEPSVEMIVGLLGILKVGAAYVPIDPHYPEERIGFILVDSAAEILLTQEKLLGKFSGEAVKKVFLDGEWESIERVDEVWQESWGAEGSALAYVLYTSGSTGTPKGVCVPHRAVNRLVVNSDYVQLGSEDVVAQISNYCFDAATFEIWGALLSGGRLVGIERESVLSAERFSAELARHG